MTADYQIVPLRKEHAAQLARMEKELFSQPWSEKAFEELLTRDYFHYLVAEQGGKAIGFAGMTTSFDEGEIDKVMVDPAWQRRGVADSLLNALFDAGEGLGISAYTLEVRVSNEPAIRLYEKHGFCGEGVRPRFYEKPTEDALIMWKRKERTC